MQLSLWYIFALVPSVFATAHVHGHLEVPSNENALDPNVRVALFPGDYTTTVRGDSSFKISKVPDGIYVLNVLSPIYVFKSYRVFVKGSDVTYYHDDTTRALDVLGDPVPTPEDNSIRVKIIYKKEFFQKEGSFNILGTLMSPMTLTTVLSLGLMLFLPKMMENMEKEIRAENGDIQAKRDPLMARFISTDHLLKSKGE